MTKVDPTTQAFIDSIMDFDERLPWECGNGKVRKGFDGKWKFCPMYCKDFRNCTGCKMRRAREFRTRVTTACARAEEAGKPWPQWQTMRDSAGPSFKQKLNRRKLDWWCAPVAEGRSIIFHEHTIEDLGSKIVTVQDFTEEQGLDWERIALTPLLRKTSGKLGKAIEEKRPEDAVLVLVVEVAQPSYLTKQQVRECQERADIKTADLDPTVDTVVEVCQQITYALQQEFELVAVDYYISQGDDQGTALLKADRDTPISSSQRYFSPSSFEPWRDDIPSTGQTVDGNRSRYSARAVPGVDFTPAPVELML